MQSIDLLRHGQQPIGDVASLCGFDVSTYFSVVFNQGYGLLPRQYPQCFQKVLSPV